MNHLKIENDYNLNFNNSKYCSNLVSFAGLNNFFAIKHHFNDSGLHITYNNIIYFNENQKFQQALNSKTTIKKENNK
jgi:hypothetical protein